MTWYENLMARKRKLGLTKIIPDRENKKTYLERLHLHEREFQLKLFGKKVTFTLPFRANLHCIHISDDEYDGLHNHPWPYITVILKGGYWEHLNNGKRKWRKPGHVIFGRANRFHRLELAKKNVLKKYPDCHDCHYMAEEEIPCWTLFVMGPRKRKNKGWGFKVDGKFWPHQEWLDKREADSKPQPSDRDEMLRSLSVCRTFNEMPFGKNEDGSERNGIFDQPWPGEPGYYHSPDPVLPRYEFVRVKFVDKNGVIGTPIIPTKNDKALNVYNNYMKGNTNG